MPTIPTLVYPASVGPDPFNKKRKEKERYNDQKANSKTETVIVENLSIS